MSATKEFAKKIESFVHTGTIYCSLQDISNTIYNNSATAINNSREAESISIVEIEREGDSDEPVVEAIELDDIRKIPYFYTPQKRSQGEKYNTFVNEGGYEKLIDYIKTRHSNEVNYVTKKQLEKELESKEYTIVSLEQQKSALRKQIELLNDNIKSKESNVNSFSEKINELNKEINLLEQTNSDCAAEITELTSQKEALAFEKEALTTKVNSFSQDLLKKSKECDELNAKLDDAQKEIENLSKKVGVYQGEGNTWLTRMGRYIESIYNTRTVVSSMVTLLSFVMVFFTAPTLMEILKFNLPGHADSALAWLGAIVFETASLVFLYQSGNWGGVKKIFIALVQIILLSIHTGVLYLLFSQATGAIIISSTVTLLFPILLLLIAFDTRMKN